MALISFMLFILAIMVSFAILINGQFNRNHETQKKRLEHRLAMLEKFISFYGRAQEYHSFDGFYELQLLFGLYGEDDEKKSMDYIISLIKSNSKNVELPKQLNELYILLTERLRAELESKRLA
ncbi:MAG TPA: hypothetical protein PLT31_07215 [Fibrobacteraceae bacterium]|jgi:hypothetical protein|nr:hypothetical protein [Fibrobacter sp.]HPW94961.1 hypothetical protein [Fibrobacteraceae bacterium]